MVPKKAIIPVGIITGPTATGKTALAIELALEHGNIEIINADSLLVYRDFNLGTAKPSLAERKNIPHHLIDIQDPETPFTAGDFVRAAKNAIEDIHARGKRALIVGGTGFYLKGLLFGIWSAPTADESFRKTLAAVSSTDLYNKLFHLDSKSAERIGPQDHYRLVRALEIIQFSGKTPTQLEEASEKNADPRFHLWILDRNSEELSQRIKLRSEKMLNQGLIMEVKQLMRQYPQARALDSVGYFQVKQYLSGVEPEGRQVRAGELGLVDEIELATRQLVKKQRTWFKNQSKQVKQSQLFILDKDLPFIREAFHNIYQKTPAIEGVHT
jgi:tRNA dimethylallyltransferase